MKTKFYNEPATYILTYIAMFIFTFGHAYTAYPETYNTYFAGKTYVAHHDAMSKGCGAMMSSIFWPLYWSVQVQK